MTPPDPETPIDQTSQDRTNQDRNSQAADDYAAERRVRYFTRRRQAKRSLDEVNYPHSLHPALVPGVSVEDQKVRYGIDVPIVVVVGVLIVAFVIWGVIAPQQVLDVSGAALYRVMANLGWLFNVLAIGMVIVLLVIALSRYGRIPLGLDGEKPEYSTASWAAMLFAAGIGIGIIFFGPYEPLTYYLDPRPGAPYDAGSMNAMKGAIAQSALHWGVNAWAIYAIVGLSVAYISYRRGKVPLMSSIVSGLWGGDSTSVPSRIIDALAIIATLFGTAASLGIGALQIARGVEIVGGLGPTGNTVAMLIIMVLTIGTIASAVSGVAKGIRRLSNINMVLSVGLAIFFFVVGPTVFLVNIIPGAITEYFGTMPDMLAANMSEGEDMQAFLSAWTTFYWAWWVSWAPFVGVFVAKISRGRTIRQFVLGVLLIPSSIIVLAFAILGGTAIWLQRRASVLDENGNTVGIADPDAAIAPDGTVDSLPLPAEIFYTVVDQLPGGGIVSALVIVVLAIFFITTADSASLVNSQMSQRGNPEPNRLVTAFWVLCMSGIAVVILLFGGENALSGLQNLVVITALPFAVILVLMAVALWKELRNDPMAIRDRYQEAAVEHAVKQGVAEYGDHFALAIEPTAPGSEYAAGGEFDSTAPEVTEWYARTDEDGNPVDYDYVRGVYLDADGNPLPEADGAGRAE
ncbi:BCCT family transporter [Brachybacterium aquaticum]|uniref:Choline/carnitine/betaine transport n=1 Tax=Brachybacterium aquaticum TaxID=1432564 RepID=A0A841AA10_9MICO|nr:BCCT family transporter [Brachybacterium aquaticum]MBB5830793.1 choline/carnitine/betaine transport [Brachybacterium aquaticum]